MRIMLLSLVVWGGLNQNWLTTTVILLLMAGSFISSWRWQIKIDQFYRVGDFVTVLFLLALLFFSLVDTEQRPVFIVLEWLPVFFLPIILVQLVSSDDQLPLGILFYSMRKQDNLRYLDFKFPYASICLLSAGAIQDSSLLYFAISIIVFSAMLWTVHSKNSPKLLWLIVMLLAVTISFWGQQGLRQLHSSVEEQIVEWLTEWQTDPFKSMTSIGEIGALKLSDRIEFRVKAKQPLLLLQSSYDKTTGRSWLASERIFSQQSNFSAPKNNSDRNSLEVFQSRKRTTILALPSGTVNITGLEGGLLRYTALGAVKLTEAPDFINFQVTYTGKNIAPVRDYDLMVPEQHKAWIDWTKQQLKLEGQSPQLIAESIKRYFQLHYRYTLFSAKALDADTALEDFILKRKAGHCEYFAVASTLLLRSYGIPARLANGYAMQEYSQFEQMYIVRRRHAHAWAIANIDGVWQELDATPSQWLGLEEEQTDLWQPVYDLFSSLYFKYKQWRHLQALDDSQDNNILFWLQIAALPLVFLSWRLYAARKHVLKLHDKEEKREVFFDCPGKESELYFIEQALIGSNRARMANESIITWAERLNNRKLLAIAQLHYKCRFDNAYFSDKDRQQLRQSVEQWLSEFK